jgi:2-dehydro-3-deoxyphosphogluconate aldolase / (4S)-4-hydroxy-2-oxoglutarate aldolase
MAQTTDIAAILGLGPVVPVIVLEDAAHAVPLARALVAGGVRVRVHLGPPRPDHLRPSS